VAPPRYKVGSKWYCSYPELKECHDPAMLPVDEVKIDPIEVNDIGLGKSIYNKEQLNQFARFQDSQGTRKAYLAETAELAYTCPHRERRMGLGPKLGGSGVSHRHCGCKLLSPVQGGWANDLLFVTHAAGVGSF
jgi:hypothetical protein